MDLLGSWKGPSRATSLVGVRRRCPQGEVGIAAWIKWEEEKQQSTVTQKADTGRMQPKSF